MQNMQCILSQSENKIGNLLEDNLNYNQFRAFYGDDPIDLPKSSPTALKTKVYADIKYDLPMQYAARLLSIDLKFLDYLQGVRKLPLEVLKDFKIGSNGDKISIPIYEDGKLVNIRYRRDPSVDKDENAGSRYSQEKNGKPALFNGDILKTGIKQVYVTEGEFDALQLVSKGITNVLSVTLGSGSFPDDWVEKFKDVQQVFLCYDTDKEGKDGMKKAAEKLGFNRCKVINLPHKDGRKKTDLTNFFVDDGGTKEDFIELVKKAESIKLDDDIKHISDFNDQLRNLLLKGEHIGIPTGFSKLDEYIGGFKMGRLIVVSGLTNCGKSSFAVNMCLKLAEAEVPSFYLSLEMPPIDIAKKILMLRAKLRGDELKKIEDPSDVLQKIDKTLSEFKGQEGSKPLPVYLYNGSGMVKLKTLETCAIAAKEQFGCKVLFVDHLHYFAVNYVNLAAEISQAVRHIKQLAIRLEITIVLLTHLNRGGRTKERKGLYIPNLADLKKCFGGDTKIYDFKTRKIYTLKEINELGIKCDLEVLDNNYKKIIISNLKCFNTGKKILKRITLKNGIKIEASLNSSLYKLDGFKKVLDLKVGDCVAYALPQNRISLMSKFDLNFLFLIGLLLSNGHIDDNLSITLPDKEVVEILHGILIPMNIKPTKKFRNNAYHVALSKGPTMGYRNKLKTILKSLKLYKSRSHNKFIPREFLDLNKLEIYSLLKGLYQGDGSFSNHNLNYSSTSYELLQNMKYLWALLGIKTYISKGQMSKKIKYVNNKSIIQRHVIYGLNITRIEDIEFFRDNIGFLGQKQRKFLLDFIGPKIKFNADNNNGFPPEIIPILERVKGTKSWRQFAYRIQKSNGMFKLPSKKMIKHIADKNSPSELDRLVDMEVEFNAITQIEDIGEQDTYDFEVPNYNNFFIENGLLVHSA